MIFEDTIVEFSEDEIDNGSLHPDFILRAAQAVESGLSERKEEVPFELSNPAQNVVSQYNVRVNGNIYSLGISKWDGSFKLMNHELENTSTLVKAGDIEIIEQDFTIEIEDYLEEEGFDVSVTDEDIEGPEAEEAKEFLDEKFGI
jgi:hypothetical protein